MARATIPVDLFNRGQVFACMGLLEAADVLLGDARGGFDWTLEEACFELCAGGTASPVEAVLEFLVEARLERLAPKGYADPTPKKTGDKKKKSAQPTDDESGDGALRPVATFPRREADRLALPLRFERNGRVVHVSHWCDASSRNPFKLFAGQQRSAAIAQQMLAGMKELWNERRAELTSDPMGLTAPLGGSSFKFDAR